jgi:hypothetical protein
MRLRHLVVEDLLVLRRSYNDGVSATPFSAPVCARLTMSRGPRFLYDRRNADCDGVSVRLVAVIVDSEPTRCKKGSWWDGDRHGFRSALSRLAWCLRSREERTSVGSFAHANLRSRVSRGRCLSEECIFW